MSERRPEQCYFCGINYIEDWPDELLAAPICPGCGAMSTADMLGKYPEKFEALIKAQGGEVYRCSCEEPCGCED